ncbi:D-2-hydroxyacid dehydrogenase [Rudanella paleaurantiibacter]|uniref:D-2-hydroxyacid dehydrogenase n=1 Tax=Rudanella paleaurantiibacter TaxID=2614655 RepID=A0A7J5TU58_9BACT|nr:D-2-hydroxyacid dehydrogenase [Rudanella paleaurantiibacter]KAB7727526.1 D-2-hydroxyacid dehydrogenase [Rudanella paleaurantiibacter]
MNLFIHTALNETNRAALRAQVGPGHTVTFRNELTDTDAQTAFQQADVLMGNPPTELLDRAPNLKFWQLDSAGFDKYSGLNLSIPVSNMGDFFAWPCAETIVAGILALYRRINELAVLQQNKTWIGAPLRYGMSLLHKQQVVILGAGTIGQAVRTILTGFECSISLMARTDPSAQLHTREELLAVLPHTDLLINCLPGSVHSFVDAEVFAAMKPGSVFANVGRGNTADETALIDALQRGHLSGAALDVTVQEPLPADSPLWTMPNVMLTQHTAGGQRFEDEGKMALFVRNLKHLEQGEPLENPVQLSRGY